MLLIWLEDARARQSALVGNKAATLASLASDYPVPPGFCVVLERREGETKMHYTDFQRDLADAYRQLSVRFGEANASVAVRSSGTNEDGKEASFAGQYDTFLNLRGAEAVISAVQQCVASANSVRANVYRKRGGPGGRFAVLVQKLVPADVSAVAFSVDPVAGTKDNVLINANWGLGESVAGGRVTPDTFTVSKADQIVSRRIAHKQRMTVLAEHGTRDVPVPDLHQREPSLSNGQILEVAALCVVLETRFGYPVDLECAFSGGNLFLLQCRPITAY